MALKNDEKSEEEFTCRFKIDIRNLTNIDSRTQKFTLYVYKYRGAIFHDTRVWCKI